MGFDCGFDIVPRLTESDSDKKRWLAFIDELKEVYKEDPVFQVQPRVVEFHVGEHPLLPSEGHKFLRFSSKVSGSLTAAAEPYIRQVYRLARKTFGQQVRFWHELNDDFGYYEWDVVRDSHRSYYNSPLDTSTTPSSLNNGLRLSTSSSDNQVSIDPDGVLPSYISISIPGKGQGLIGAQNIPKGSRVLSEKPIFTVPQRGYNDETMNQLIANKLKQVSKDNQRVFLALHNNFRGSLGPFLGIAKANVLPLGPNATEGGLFLQASRINHACLPNCQHAWNGSIGEETIHAVRDIAKGEEITISYSDSSPSKIRRDRLLRDFGFECTCSLCSLPATERMRSDDRLAEIQHIDIAIGDGAHLMQHPQQHLQIVHSLVVILEAEEISDARLPRAYYDAFQTVIAHGDQARAKIFAERAYTARLCCVGEDSPATLQMKLLAESSKSHRLFGTSRKWIQNETKIPKGLGGEAFEKWLWRQSV